MPFCLDMIINKQSIPFHCRKNVNQRGLHGSVKLKQMYEHMKENGELIRTSESAHKEGKQGEMDYKAFQLKKQQAEMTR